MNSKKMKPFSELEGISSENYEKGAGQHEKMDGFFTMLFADCGSCFACLGADGGGEDAACGQGADRGYPGV